MIPCKRPAEGGRERPLRRGWPANQGLRRGPERGVYKSIFEPGNRFQPGSRGARGAPRPALRIGTASSSRALASCRRALVGQGRFAADIYLAGQQPYPAVGRLLVFNGRRHGRPALLGHIYSARPFATSFVIPFSVRQRAHSRFGTELTAALPPSLRSWGNVTGIEMRLSRRYFYRGARRSFLSAGCPAPKGFPGAVFALARASFGFADGTSISVSETGNCKATGR